MSYLVGATHKYGKSYLNRLRRMGCRQMATKFGTEKEACAASVSLAGLVETSHKMSHDGVRYTDIIIEEADEQEQS